jgi:hypothetical protein
MSGRAGADLRPSTGTATLPFPGTLLALAGVAFAVRIAVAIYVPHVVYPDEIFQWLEPAHRLVFGTGVVAWEYVVGIRSWLFPGLIAGLLWLGHLTGSQNPDVILFPVAAFMSLASTAPVICGYLWGYHVGGRRAAIVVGAINALWVELICFAPLTLTEVLASDCLVVAVYLAYPGFEVAARRRLFWAGMLFGLTVMLRFHLAPIVAVAAVWTCRARLRERCLPMAAGALIPVLLGGLLDAATWSYPFQSIWLNAWLNVVARISEDFGTSPVYQYAVYFLKYWGGATAVLLLGTLVGGRRLPLLLVLAAAIVLLHTAIPHKEYRFVYPALPFIVTLAGIATFELVDFLQKRLRPLARLDPSLAMAAAIGFWGLTSLAVAVSPSFRPLWSDYKAALAAFRALSRDPDLCGVGVGFDGLEWYQTAGASHLPPAVPLYDAGPRDFASKAAAFNAVLTLEGTEIPDRRFTRDACFANGPDEWLKPQPALCLWRRAGGCTAAAAPPPEVNWPSYFTLAGIPDEREP